jgi:DNA repair protein SbcC/Rad50
MRPHRLRVTAFGAFGSTVEVGFDDLASAGLFLLHGETGAGKTTLLDAIGFALYGQVPGERAKTKRLRSDHAAGGTPTEVQLEATIGGRRMRITRRPEQERPKRRGSGTTTEPAKVLLEESDGASWRAVSTRVGEADDEINHLMGMSAAQFFQVVLLPQGEFAKFLHANAEDRSKLLRKLFGTDRFAAVEEWLADRRRATAHEVTEAEQAIKELDARILQVAGVIRSGVEPAVDVDDDHALPDAGWAAQLAQEAAEQAAVSEGQVKAGRDALDAALDTQLGQERLAGRQRRRLGAQQDQDDLAARHDQVRDLRRELDAAARAAEVAPALAEAERTADVLTQARTSEEQARSRVGRPAGASPASASPAAASAGAADLRAASQEQAARAGRLQALRSLARQADDEDRAAVTARAEAAALAARIDAATDVASTGSEQRLELVSERDEAREAGDQLSAARAEADRYRRAADDAAALVRARADARREEQAYLTARLQTADLRDVASRLRETRIDGMRAELAATLVDGAPCPVCGSLDHPELCELRGERVTRDQEEAADAEAAAAADRAEMIGAKLAAADILVADLTARLEGAGFTAAVDLASLEAGADGLAASARGLAAEAAQLTTIAARHGDLQAALDVLDTELVATDKRVVELTEQRESELRQASEADQRSARHRTSLLAQLDGQADLESALGAALDAADALAAAADAADATVRAQADAHRAEERALQAAAGAGFADLDRVRDAQRSQDWRAATDQAIRDHEALVRAVAELLADPDLDVPLDPPADVSAAAAAVDAARLAQDEALAAHDRAQHRAEQLVDLAPQLSVRLDALRPLTAQAAEARRLADLAAGQGANALRMTLSSFVLAARLEEVAAAATERLLTMTSGRYGLVHTDARRGAGRSGLGLLACDAWTGVDRDTSTLSGGETFLASLALALGLADVVTAEAGGTRIEALFVDEGFGSLDDQTLEEVMTVLDGLREGGRMVGIVSHVAELRQRVPAQIHVRKGRAGSHLDVRAPGCS